MGISFCKISQKKERDVFLSRSTTHYTGTATATAHATFASRPPRSILLANVLRLLSSTDDCRRKFFSISKIFSGGENIFFFLTFPTQGIASTRAYFSLPVLLSRISSNHRGTNLMKRNATEEKWND